MTKEKRWWQSAHIFEFFKRRWTKVSAIEEKKREEEDEEEERERRTQRSYTFATSSSPSISSSRFLPSSFRRLSCSNLCFAWSVFDAWRRDGRALISCFALALIYFSSSIDKGARTHTKKPTPPTPPTRLHQHNNRDEDERSSKDDLLETTTDRTRFAIQNHAGADRTTTNVRAMTTDESDFDFCKTFSSQKKMWNFQKFKLQNSSSKLLQKNQMSKNKSTQKHVKRCPNK